MAPPVKTAAELTVVLSRVPLLLWGRDDAETIGVFPLSGDTPDNAIVDAIVTLDTYKYKER